MRVDVDIPSASLSQSSSSSFLLVINGALQLPQMSGRYSYLTLFRRTLSFNKVQCESEPILSLKWNPPVLRPPRGCNKRGRWTQGEKGKNN